MDPLASYNVADAKAGFDVESENPTYATVRSTMEFYFTINGHYLSTSTNQNFKVAYVGSVEKPSFTPPANGAVLYPEVTCDGLKVGSGAGYFAADVKDENAIDQLATTSSEIGAAHLGVAGNAPSRVLSLTFGSKDAQGNYIDGYYSGSARAETKKSGSDVTLSVKSYDRNAKKIVEKSATFHNCH
jgi:hypothetical protein